MQNFNPDLLKKDYVVDTQVSPLRSFDQLTPEEQQKVLKLKIREADLP